MSKQVKSKERVSSFGEVFTSDREVNAMLDLVKDESENIESTFLEPACGDGNFLSEILKRKLNIVKDRYCKIHNLYEIYSIIAVSSVYGVDLLNDNVLECQKRLFEIWNDEYTKICKKDANELCRESCKFILKKNILCGDALTMQKIDGTPITFSEWKLASNTLIKRRDYQFSQLLDNSMFIPEPVKEYQLTDYRRLKENE